MHGRHAWPRTSQTDFRVGANFDGARDLTSNLVTIAMAQVRLAETMYKESLAALLPATHRCNECSTLSMTT